MMPDDLAQTDVNTELQTAISELNKIIDEDKTNIQDLCIKENKTIPFKEYAKPEYIVNKGFWIPDDNSFDKIAHYYAHWIMCVTTLEIISQKVLDMVAELKEYYKEYLNTGEQNRKFKFFYFVRAYQDFYGFLISIRNIIQQYYDLFVRTCNEIDSQNKEKPIYAYRSDIDHDQILAAVKELLLHGNWGRLAGFALLRSALEVFVTRKLFDPKNSKKYYNNEITFPQKEIPTLNSICGRIDKLQLGTYFKTDSIRRLYDWQSIVAHRGLLTEEYLIWFVYYVAVREVIVSFNNNLDQYGDQILAELHKVGKIRIK
jgi:hypothetical protein